MMAAPGGVKTLVVTGEGISLCQGLHPDPKVAYWQIKTIAALPDLTKAVWQVVDAPITLASQRVAGE